ncbi:levansucrase [Micromonospora sp. WMMD1102]|uniref:levansucrase n=1 Tax=Micromonospora sp. WMMD1102 TaxID=3016105 RepID=UPI00241551B6|nr:levansucrase [Micromonospora sp. WMMD1102]MDG4786583.1 levansucrase [Micromonospora sp. WMMD1102]
MDATAPDPVRAYLDGTAQRLQADGCEVRTEDWNGLPVLVGYRADFRLQWMATKLHLFTLAAPAPLVTARAIEEFTISALDYVVARKGQLRGMQSGVAVFPALVGSQVEPAAVDWAQRRQVVRFAAMARPVVVDAGTGTAACFRGFAALGLFYSAHFRRKLAAYFPSS